VVVSSLVLHNIHDGSGRKRQSRRLCGCSKAGGMLPSSMSGTRISTSRSCARAACTRSQDRVCISPRVSPCAW
jgi:hypothetical protein